MESGPNTVLDDPTSLTIVQAAKAAMATDHPEVVGRLEALARQSERDVYVLKVAQQVLRGQPGSRWNSLSF
jgi:hypothetical protein